MKAIWAVAFLLIGGVALSGLFVHYRMQQDAKISRDVMLISPGIPVDEVIRLLGTPSWRSQCGSRFPYSPRKECAEELVYGSSFGYIISRYYAIEVGHDERVVSVKVIQSP